MKTKSRQGVAIAPAMIRNSAPGIAAAKKKSSSNSLPSLAQFSRQLSNNSRSSLPPSAPLLPLPPITSPSPVGLPLSAVGGSSRSRNVGDILASSSRAPPPLSSLRLSDIALKPMESSASYVGWVVKKNELPVAIRKKHVSCPPPYLSLPYPYIYIYILAISPCFTTLLLVCFVFRFVTHDPFVCCEKNFDDFLFDDFSPPQVPSIPLPAPPVKFCIIFILYLPRTRIMRSPIPGYIHM